MIEPLPRAMRDYLAGFNLGCILVSSTGEIQVLPGKHLARMGTVAADLATAHQVVQAIGEQRPGSVEEAVAEIVAASTRCGVTLSEHSVVVARAQAAVDRLHAKLATAQSTGDLKFFNRAYRQYRLGCQQRGEHAMPYSTAVARLRKLLAGAAAGAPVSDVVAAVFGR